MCSDCIAPPTSAVVSSPTDSPAAASIPSCDRRVSIDQHTRRACSHRVFNPCRSRWVGSFCQALHTHLLCVCFHTIHPLLIAKSCLPLPHHTHGTCDIGHRSLASNGGHCHGPEVADIVCPPLPSSANASAQCADNVPHHRNTAPVA